MKEELFFVDRDGKLMDYPIFASLLEVLLPAFNAGADEIQIGHTEPGGIRGSYTKDGKSFPLAIEPHFHWAEVFVRVKIIAGLSIREEKQQKGELSVEFNDRLIGFSVETTENENEHSMHLTRG